MTPLRKLAGFGSAGLIAASAVTYVAVSRQDPLALIGEVPEATGGVAGAYDGNGRFRVGLYGSSDGKRFLVTKGSSSSSAIASRSEGANGRGRLQLMSADGVTMVGAGVTAEHLGVVRAGPVSFKRGIGALGLPGIYISGWPN